eukprot:9178148-Ditylum_brightwellii.AAC.1
MPDGEGGVAVPESLENSETIPDIFIADKACRQFKHMLPNMNSLNNWRLPNEMKDFLQAEMDFERIYDELLAFCRKLNSEDERDLTDELVIGDIAPDLIHEPVVDDFV